MKLTEENHISKYPSVFLEYLKELIPMYYENNIHPIGGVSSLEPNRLNVKFEVPFMECNIAQAVMNLQGEVVWLRTKELPYWVDSVRHIDFSKVKKMEVIYEDHYFSSLSTESLYTVEVKFQY